MDYQTFVATQFIPRILAALNALNGNLVSAGASPNEAFNSTEFS